MSGGTFSDVPATCGRAPGRGEIRWLRPNRFIGGSDAERRGMTRATGSSDAVASAMPLRSASERPNPPLPPHTPALRALESQTLVIDRWSPLFYKQLTRSPTLPPKTQTLDSSPPLHRRSMEPVMHVRTRAESVHLRRAFEPA